MRLSQRQWEARQTDGLPVGAVTLLQEGHAARIGQTGPDSTSPWYLANRWLNTQAGALKKAQLWKAFNEEVIRTQADNAARVCARLQTLTMRSGFARSLGVQPPEPDRLKTEAGCRSRLEDPLWWRRQLRKIWTRAAESGLRSLGLIRKGREPYASDQAVFFRRGMQRRMQKFLERHDLLNEAGEQLSLLRIAAHSLANPSNRNTEMMVRLRGLQEVADDQGHVAHFITFTAPSAFHAQLHAGGDNPRYNNTTVREAQRWLCRIWSYVRATYAKEKLPIYGFRTVEPHHDATPHWHLVLFCLERDSQRVRQVFENYALSEFADEPGARDKRIVFKQLDADKGCAAGYMSKYIAKNLDAAGSMGSATDDETDTPVAANTEKVITWARVHGIRQFQQFGGIPVGLWREVRRIRSEDDIDDPDILNCWRAAEACSYRDFIYACGGIELGRDSHLRLLKELIAAPNRYGEPRAPRILGLRYCNGTQLTRPHSWRIVRCGMPYPPFSGPPWVSTAGTALPATRRLYAMTDPPTPAPSLPPVSPARGDSPAPLDADPFAEHHRTNNERAVRHFWSGSSPLGPVAITVTAGEEARAARTAWVDEAKADIEARIERMWAKLRARTAKTDTG